MKVNSLIFVLILPVFMFSNDNPFIAPKDVEKARLQELEKEDIKFSSDARAIKDISITYISFDGTEKTMKLNINKSIDWHETYSLIKNKTQSPDSTQIMDVSVTIPENKKINATSSEINSSVNIQSPNENGKIEEFLSFATYDKSIKLVSSDEIVGNFALGNPSKIVIDFKRNAAFNTKSINLKKAPFKRISIGSHNTYYRLVIYLDGKYNYKIEKNADGYTVLII
ncbi:AMIN domain-containing protein [uncultured Campylobacter sp.]|uniref:AMIN domain-containing protein n=1 Tax=uncultured Campylobacter sp. TaxID=218934 RepID=UPI00262BCC71|nr:AMIN domain-containing protein [uncultured Campylobacter sp.]